MDPMSNLGPDRTLILPPRSDDIFDSNYHPDLDAQDELYFQAYRDAGLGSRTRESKSRAHANVTLGKLLLVLFVGVPVLSYVMYHFVMMLGH